MNLPDLLTSETAIWVALIAGIVALISYFMNHKFTQIREREKFEREIARLQYENARKNYEDATRKLDEAKKEHSEAIKEKRTLEIQALLLMDQLKNEDPEGLEAAHQEFLKIKKVMTYVDPSSASAISWLIAETERTLSQDRGSSAIDEEEE